LAREFNINQYTWKAVSNLRHPETNILSQEKMPLTTFIILEVMMANKIENINVNNNF
jgi:hypothetical protein